MIWSWLHWISASEYHLFNVSIHIEWQHRKTSLPLWIALARTLRTSLLTHPWSLRLLLCNNRTMSVSNICFLRSSDYKWVWMMPQKNKLTMICSKAQYPQSSTLDSWVTLCDHAFQAWYCVGIKYPLATACLHVSMEMAKDEWSHIHL